MSPAITNEGRPSEAARARTGPGWLLAAQGFDLEGDASTVALMEVGLVRPSVPTPRSARLVDSVNKELNTPRSSSFCVSNGTIGSRELHPPTTCSSGLRGRHHPHVYRACASRVGGPPVLESGAGVGSQRFNDDTIGGDRGLMCADAEMVSTRQAACAIGGETSAGVAEIDRRPWNVGLGDMPITLGTDFSGLDTPSMALL